MKAKLGILALAAAALAAGCHARLPPAPPPAPPSGPLPGHVLLLPAPVLPTGAGAALPGFCVSVDGPGRIRSHSHGCANAGARALLPAPARDFVVRVSLHAGGEGLRPPGGRWPETVVGAVRGDVLVVQPRLLHGKILETRIWLLRGEGAARILQAARTDQPPVIEDYGLGDPGTVSVVELAP